MKAVKAIDTLSVKVKEEVVQKYRELNTQSYISKAYDIPMNAVKKILTQYLSKGESQGIIEQRRNKFIRLPSFNRRAYLVSAVNHLYHGKGIKDFIEIADILHVSEDYVKRALNL